MPSLKYSRLVPERLSIAMGAVVLPVVGCTSAPAPAPDDSQTLSTAQPIHNEPSCALDNLGIEGALLEAGLSRYGAWCGATNVGPMEPVNCWDNACRTHDYAFHGPGGSGHVSCHEVINSALCGATATCIAGVPLPNTAPDTDCIRAADLNLCDAWYQCTADAAAAQHTWEWVGNGKKTKKRQCVDKQGGAKPTRCAWYEHPLAGAEEVWTCGVCPSGAPQPPNLPNPACAVQANLSDEAKLQQCCGDYSGDLKPDVCKCPDEKPLRRDLGATFFAVECRACPPDRPNWNGNDGPCQEAYPGGGAPSGAVECCESCAPFLNGSFESASINPGGGLIEALQPGDSSILGWTVTSGDVDYIGGYWSASAGARSLDMSGFQAGSISQKFETVEGEQYEVRFDLSGEPFSHPPQVKTLQISVGGSTANFSFDSSISPDRASMHWAEQTFSFVASGKTTTLTFSSLDASDAGPALDNVRVFGKCQATPP